MVGISFFNEKMLAAFSIILAVTFLPACGRDLQEAEISRFILEDGQEADSETNKDESRKTYMEELGRYVSEIEENMMKKQVLDQLIYDVQEAYKRQDSCYYPYAVDFSFCVGNDIYKLQPEDMEKLKFYSYANGNEEDIYFVPEDSLTTNELYCEGKNIMFRFIKKEIYPRREMEDSPETILYCVYPTDVTDIVDMFCELGTIEKEFVFDKSIEENSLSENEYVQATIDMIHGTLKGESAYGEYDIYIGEYCMTDDVSFYDMLEGKGVEITAAVICSDNGYGYYCRFVASDILIDGKIKIFYALPPTANAWKDIISQIMDEKRLIIPLEVTQEDEIAVQENPYHFIMVPVLDYAVGDGIFPEDAVRCGNLIFY